MHLKFIRQRIQIVMTIVLLTSTAVVRSQDASSDVRPDYPRAVIFFHHFQDALRKNDRNEVSRLIRYPLLVILHHRNARIHSKKELLVNFDAIFDAGVRCEVLDAKDRDVWGRYDGFSIGGGAIWFDDFSPPGTNTDVNAPDYWTKGTFQVMTVNNGSYYDCKEGA